MNIEKTEHMTIGIDARWIFPEITGIGNYTRELIRHLALIDKSNSYALLFNDQTLLDRTVAETGIAEASNFRTILLPYGVFSLRNQFALPRALKSARMDIFHSTNYMIPFLAFPGRKAVGLKCVTTVHDLIPMVFPDHAPRSRKARFYPVYKYIMRQVGRQSDAIITDSSASRADILKYLSIPPARAGKVKVVHCGVSDRLRTSARTAGALKDGPSTESRTILYVGRSDPYKNITGLIEIFAIVRRRLSCPSTLVIAGPADDRYPEPARLAAKLGIQQSIRWTGYVPDEELASLYREADVLVHPSFYEGFGLQVVEAMASGLPVVCSNAGSLPEVAADAAVIVDPHDIESFAEKTVEVLTNPAMAEALSQKGIERAAQYSWKETAVKTLAVYSGVLAHKSKYTLKTQAFPKKT